MCVFNSINYVTVIANVLEKCSGKQRVKNMQKFVEWLSLRCNTPFQNGPLLKVALA
jgi:hypothetical protein